MIIFRVTTGRSFTKLPSPKDGAVSNPLQFAAHQIAESSFLQSTLNREFGQGGDPVTQRELRASVDGPTQTRVSTIHFTQDKWDDSGDVEKAA